MFKVGDKVMHKSDGPVMVVSKENHPKAGQVLCKWYDNQKRQFATQSFREEELNPYKEGPRAIAK